MRILAIDYGRSRVGIAMSDPLGIIAQPLMTLEVKSQKKLVDKIVAMIEENSIGLVIIGNPLSHRGKPTEISGEIERFVKKIERRVCIEIRLWDERFTSQYALNKIKTMGLKNTKTKIDQVAASIILEEFLKTEHHV